MQKRIKKFLIIIIFIFSLFTLCGCEDKRMKGFENYYKKYWNEEAFLYPTHLQMSIESTYVSNDSANIYYIKKEFEGKVELSNFNVGKALNFTYVVTEHNEIGDGFESKYDGKTLLVSDNKQDYFKNIEGGIELRLDFDIFFDDLDRIKSQDYYKVHFFINGLLSYYLIDNEYKTKDAYYTNITENRIYIEMYRNVPFYENNEYKGEIYEKYEIRFNFEEYNIEVEQSDIEYIDDFEYILHFGSLHFK